jgi:hypothetical protein
MDEWTERMRNWLVTYVLLPLVQRMQQLQQVSDVNRLLIFQTILFMNFLIVRSQSKYTPQFPAANNTDPDINPYTTTTIRGNAVSFYPHFQYTRFSRCVAKLQLHALTKKPTPLCAGGTETRTLPN